MDWTNSFKQNEINEFSNIVLEVLLDGLVNLDIKEFKDSNISSYSCYDRNGRCN